MMANLATAWWTWMTAMSLQVAVLILLLAAVDRLLGRRASPGLLLALWLLAPLKLLLPPTLSSPISLARLQPAIEQPARVIPGVPDLAPPTSLAAAWLAGVVALLGLSLWRLRRHRRGVTELTNESLPRDWNSAIENAVHRVGLRRRPTVAVANEAAGPAVCGYWRPIVVLPESLVRSATATQREHVLLHEFAHLRRRDPLIGLVVLTVTALYWFHPLVWLARRRILSLLEICCDRSVVRLVEDRTAYRNSLLEFARPLVQRECPARLAFGPRQCRLLERLDWLTRPLPMSAWRDRLASPIACGLALAVAVPLAPPTRVTALVVGPVAASADTPEVSLAAAVSVAAADRAQDLPGCFPKRFAFYRLLAQVEERAGGRELAASSAPNSEPHP